MRVICSMNSLKRISVFIVAGCCLLGATNAESPVSFYIFPAGGQKGTEVEFKVGGAFFHGGAEFSITGEGLTPSPRVEETETLTFHQPLLHEPFSSRAEDYPLDHLGKIKIDKNAAAGARFWTCKTVQGVTERRKFIVGDLPEIVEEEINGEPVPQTVPQLPITINGRVHPIEDVDYWDFDAPAGETVICELVSTQLGHKLEPIVEIQDPNGEQVKPIISMNGDDPTLWFEVKTSGRHRLKIHDARYWGHQSYVYRLTLKTGPHPTSIFPLGGRRGELIEAKVEGLNMESEAISVELATENSMMSIESNGRQLHLHVDELSEIMEGEGSELIIPSIANGQIMKPGEVDSWFVDLGAKEMIQLEIIAAQVGSRLDSSLKVIDPATERQITVNDDKIAGQLDSVVTFTAPKAGRYEIQVADQYPSRGGADFGYRLKVTKPDPHDFRLTLNKAHINVTAQQLPEEGTKPTRVRGKGVEIEMHKSAAFQTDVMLEAVGLPEGVTMSTDKLQYRRPKLEIYFDAPPDLTPQIAEVTIRGTAEIILDKKTKETKTVVRDATIALPFGEPRPEKLQIAFAPFVPFKHQGAYALTADVPAGGTLTKPFKIERMGYDGPLRVRLGERQGRNLQGITGPVMELPAGASEFVYRIQYPAEMELGRTTRVQLLVEAEIPDAEGKPRTLSFTSFDRPNQIMSIASNGWLSLSTSKPNLVIKPGETAPIPLEILRGPQLKDRPVKLELVVPAHIQGITAETVDVAGDQSTAELLLEVGDDPGPINMPIRIRATTSDENPDRHIAETKIELLPPLAETVGAQ